MHALRVLVFIICAAIGSVVIGSVIYGFTMILPGRYSDPATLALILVTGYFVRRHIRRAHQ
jgi:hypothetical protein